MEHKDLDRVRSLISSIQVELAQAQKSLGKARASCSELLDLLLDQPDMRRLAERGLKSVSDLDNRIKDLPYFRQLLRRIPTIEREVISREKNVKEASDEVLETLTQIAESAESWDDLMELLDTD